MNDHRLWIETPLEMDYQEPSRFIAHCSCSWLKRTNSFATAQSYARQHYATKLDQQERMNV